MLLNSTVVPPNSQASRAVSKLPGPCPASYHEDHVTCPRSDSQLEAKVDWCPGCLSLFSHPLQAMLSPHDIMSKAGKTPISEVRLLGLESRILDIVCSDSVFSLKTWEATLMSRGNGICNIPSTMPG